MATRRGLAHRECCESHWSWVKSVQLTGEADGAIGLESTFERDAEIETDASRERCRTLYLASYTILYFGIFGAVHYSTCPRLVLCIVWGVGVESRPRAST